jgi:hypothetical protein
MVTRCGLCSAEFDEDRSQPTCKACPLGDGCGLIRCPHCGYENPSTPAWLSTLLARLRTPAPPTTRPTADTGEAA